MEQADAVDRDAMKGQLLRAFAALSHVNGCRRVFTFSADMNVVTDQRDFDFYVRLFFHRVDSQNRTSFDPELVCESKGEWFASVAVREEFDRPLVEEASAWLLREKEVRVWSSLLPL